MPTIQVPNTELHLVTLVGLSFEGQAPRIDIGYQTSDGALSVSGQQPGISVDELPIVAESSAGTLAWFGHTPALEILINSAESSLGLASLAPVVSNSAPPFNIIYPQAGSLSITGLEPARGLGLELNGLVPEVFGEITIETPVGEISLLGSIPVVTANDLIVEPNVGALGLTGYVPVLTGLGTPPPGSLALTGLQIQPLAYSWITEPGENFLSINTYAPTVTIEDTGKVIKGRFRRRMYAVTIDGQDFVVANAAQVASLLREVRELAEEKIETDEPIKAPVITVKTKTGKQTRASGILSEVRKTRQSVAKSIQRQQKRISRDAIDREIGQLLIEKIRKEEDEATLILLM